jgi:hypothetical protein
VSRQCRSGVRSSNEKSLLILGLIGNEFARRIHGLGKLAEGEELGSNLLRASDVLERNLACCAYNRSSRVWPDGSRGQQRAAT